jgi:hypothetical protein
VLGEIDLDPAASEDAQSAIGRRGTSLRTTMARAATGRGDSTSGSLMAVMMAVTTMPPTSFDRAFNFKEDDNGHSERTRKMPRIVSGLFGGTSNKNPRGVSHCQRKATEQSFPSLTRRRSVDRQAEFVEYRTFDADVERLIRKLRLDQGARVPAGIANARARSLAAPIANREQQKSTAEGRKCSQLFSVGALNGKSAPAQPGDEQVGAYPRSFRARRGRRPAVKQARRR